MTQYKAEVNGQGLASLLQRLQDLDRAGERPNTPNRAVKRAVDRRLKERAMDANATDRASEGATSDEQVDLAQVGTQDILNPDNAFHSPNDIEGSDEVVALVNQSKPDEDES